MIEHTLIAHLGHLLIIISFVFSIFTIISYYLAASGKSIGTSGWQNYGRLCFGIHSFATLSAISLLFFIISRHYFEFHYVWKYSSLDMELKYIFSCFWSGQEGSLFLWSFWIIIITWLGVLYKPFEKWIMPFVGGAQFFIISMLLGVYFFGVKIGNSPFILIRELPENAGMPWAQLPDYLTRITAFQDGVGLNPLLQNYWMTIHPPVLFLGFAASLFPFAFAAAGLWQRKFDAFLKPAIPWTVFGVMSLGAGILMGGAWAYEALSFGGFWAWDPVENASLVPWLLMIAAVHSLLITVKRKKGYFMSFFITMTPFLMVLYSSFLTRSGILGESSVHSFTENGLFLHLLLFFIFSFGLSVLLCLINTKLKIWFSVVAFLVFVFYWISGNLDVVIPVALVCTIIFLAIAYDKYFSGEAEESKFSSREFWLFTGSIIVILSALQITVATSIPVINKIYGTSIDALTDLPKRSAFYHTWQIPFAILITLFMGLSQFLKYRNTSLKTFAQQISLPLFLAFLTTVLLTFYFGFHPFQEWIFIILLFTTLFAIASNSVYFIQILKGKWDFAGSTVAHIGLGLILLGALISSSKKIEISRNHSNFDLQNLNETFKNNENILLRQGDTLLMDQYFVTFKSKYKKGVNLYYEMGYYKPFWDPGLNVLRPGDSLFTLYPFVQVNEKFGNVAEPDTYHYLGHDIFTHIKWADMEVLTAQDGPLGDGFMGETLMKLSLGKKYEMENLHIFFHDIYLMEEEEKARRGFTPTDVAIQAELYVRDTKNKALDSVLIKPVYVVEDSSKVISLDYYSDILDARFRIAELSREPNNLILGLRQREYVVMQALVFPAMNVLWTGCFVMVLGCFMALRQRWRRRRGDL